MKGPYICPNCGTKQVKKINFWILILCSITIIGIIPWMIWWFKQVKCPKCGCVMHGATAVQVKNLDNEQTTKS